MADFSITLTVPDDRVQELVDAINWHAPVGEDGNGDPLPDRTAAECRAWFKGRCETALKDIHQRHQKFLREQQAIAGEIDIT